MDNYKSETNIINEEKKGYQAASLEGKVDDAKKENKPENLNEFKRRERQSDRRPDRHQFQSETLETKRVVKVTKGGRRFSFTSLVLVKDESSKAVAYACSSGREVMVAFRKAFRKAQKPQKLITYFPTPVRTIPRDIVVEYKAIKLLLKPAPLGSGIKASKELSKLFNFLGIKDISAKLICSHQAQKNKLNVIRAAFLALDKLTGKKYDY